MADLPALADVLQRDEILRLQELVRRVPAAPSVIHYALELVRKTRPRMTAPAVSADGGGRKARGKAEQAATVELVDRLVNYGAGPRAVQFLLLGGKARAVMKGRKHVSIADVRALAHAVLRHRILTNYAAEAEGYDADRIIDSLLEAFPGREIDETTDGGVKNILGS